jgi:hypothetical protein
VTWQPGHDRIDELLAAGELEQVTPADARARRLLEDAGRHLDTAATAVNTGDLAGAYLLAYDALRKSAASLLAAQGLRATLSGTAAAWLPSSMWTPRLRRASARARSSARRPSSIRRRSRAALGHDH